MCINFLIGFCPSGPKCKYTHPSWELPTVEIKGAKCHICGELGHKANMCRLNPYKTSDEGGTEQTPSTQSYGGLVIHIPQNNTSNQSVSSAALPGGLPNTPLTGMSPTSRMKPMRDISRVTCFKCGRKGHYANRCNESSMFPMPFLSKPTTT